MTAFTPVNDWTYESRDLAGANEIVLAYSERRQALGWGAVDALSEGDNVLSKTLWVEMQVWLEACCTSFVDHVNGPWNDEHTDFRYFTKATWQAAAGLNVSEVEGESFRRKINHYDDFSYGYLQAGDYRQGSHTFEDLQKGFGALRWTSAGAYGTDLGYFGMYGQEYDDIASGWSGLSWIENEPHPTFAAAFVDNYGNGPWDVAKHRGRLSFETVENASIAALIERVTLFGLVTKHPYGYPLPDEIGVWGDFEAPGAEGEVLELEDFVGPLSPKTVYSTNSMYGNSSVIVPYPGEIPAETILGWGLIGLGLTKWTFTNE